MCACVVILYDILHVADIHTTNSSVGIGNYDKKYMIRVRG